VADQDVQFDFRDTVDPIYRELIGLQLVAAVDSPRVATSREPPAPTIANPSLLEGPGNRRCPAVGGTAKLLWQRLHSQPRGRGAGGSPGPEQWYRGD
jgi:hypothetical protein